MKGLKIGVFLPCLKLGLEEGLKKTAEMGAIGVQLWNAGGEMDPDNLSPAGRKNLIKLVNSYGLTISALCGDLGVGFGAKEGLKERIQKTKQLLDLGVDLETPIMSTHIGVIPEVPDSEAWKTMMESLIMVGEYAVKTGTCIATETGPESPELMAKFLKQANCPGLKVNYDPANLVMSGFDPVKGVYELRDFIVHTHAKDAVRLPDGTPKEVPLGEGEVPFPLYIQALKEIGYDGFFTIEREVGDNPVVDIIAAKDFLSQF